MQFKSIQLLRGLAAIYVFLFHVKDYLFIEKKSILNYVFSKGYTGVDIFFVISGFVISFSIQGYKGKKGVFHFLLARAIRIYPTYWVIASFFLVFGTCRSQYDVTFIFKSFLLLPGYVLLCTVSSWTLCFEMLFYILSSLLILSKKFIAVFFLLFFMCIFSVINFYFPTGLFIPEKAPWSLHFLEFFLGFIAFTYYKKISVKAAIAALLIGLLLHFSPFMDGPIFKIFQIVLPSFLIVLGIVVLEVSKKIKIHSWFIQLGNASYILYLINFGLSFIALRQLTQKSLFSNSLVMVFFFSTIALSIVLYKYLEKPSQLFFKKHLLA